MVEVSLGSGACVDRAHTVQALPWQVALVAVMMDRRVVLGGLAATALVPSVALAQGNEPVFGLGLIAADEPLGLYAEFVRNHPPGTRMFSRELLYEAWRLTKGKTPQAMHAVLIETFGAFPLWFVDDLAWVVILGVGTEPTAEEWHSWGGESQGYIQCDARVIRMRNADGVWEQRDTIERPPRFDGGYVTS
jgi:hypothetical protein